MALIRSIALHAKEHDLSFRRACEALGYEYQWMNALKNEFLELKSDPELRAVLDPHGVAAEQVQIVRERILAGWTVKRAMEGMTVVWATVLRHLEGDSAFHAARGRVFLRVKVPPGVIQLVRERVVNQGMGVVQAINGLPICAATVSRRFAEDGEFQAALAKNRAGRGLAGTSGAMSESYAQAQERRRQRLQAVEAYMEEHGVGFDRACRELRHDTGILRRARWALRQQGADQAPE